MSYTRPSPEEVTVRRARLAPFDSWNEAAYLTLFALLCAGRGIPETYLDLGSGTGAMVNMARKLGIEAYGADVISQGPGKEHWFINHDLTQPLWIGEMAGPANPELCRKFDLITCIETAEHLPESAAGTLCDTIERHMANYGVLIFSAAPPGQAGEHHRNLQAASYWRSMLYERGISYREDYTRSLSHLWSWTAGPMIWLGANVQVFDR